MDNEPLFEDNVIDVTPRKRRRWLIVLVAVIVALFLFGSPLLGIYIDSLWFSSVGYADVYWYKFKLGGALWLLFFVATFLLIRLPFFLLNRALPALTERPRVRLASIQDVRDINLLPLIYRPGVWVLSAIVALIFASSMSQAWSTFALYLNGAASGVKDPIFDRDTSFYLFKLPALDLLAGWFFTLTMILFVAIALLSLYVHYIETVRGANLSQTSKQSVVPASLAGALLAVAAAVELYLNRFAIVTTTHEIFSGANYTDVNVRLTGMMALIIALAIAAVVLIANAFVMKRVRVLGATAVLLALVWLIGGAAANDSILLRKTKRTCQRVALHSIQHRRDARGLRAEPV
jgi:uncharacterized membrane protein (UPF0182 family)